MKSSTVSPAVSQLIMRVNKRTVAYKLALQYEANNYKTQNNKTLNKDQFRKTFNLLTGGGNQLEFTDALLIVFFGGVCFYNNTSIIRPPPGLTPGH